METSGTHAGMELGLGGASRERVVGGATLLISLLEALALIALFFSTKTANGRALPAIVFLYLKPMSPIILLGLLYAWALKLCTLEAKKHSIRINHAIDTLLHPFAPFEAWIQSANLRNAVDSVQALNRPRLFLAVALISAGVIVYTPYRPDINPMGTPVGTDTPLYISWVDQILSRPISQALQYAFAAGGQGTRPLALILLYFIASISHANADQVVRIFPLVLAPLLVVSSYVFVWSGLEDERLAGLVAILTSFSFNITVGMWAGYLANWLALAESYLFLAILLKFVRSPSTLKAVAMMILSASILLTHPWTWGIIISVTAIYALTSRRELRKKFAMESMALIVVAGIIADVLKNWLFAAQTLGGDLASRTVSYGIAQFLNTWQNIIDALLVRYDGLLGHSSLLGLAFLAVSAIKSGSGFERLLTLWVVVGALPFTLLDGYHQTRIIYDLPIPTLASAGLVFILQRFGQRTSWSWGILLATVLFNANYALSAMLHL